MSTATTEPGLAVPRPLQGNLVRLRAGEPEDEPLLHAWINDTEVIENLAMRYPISHPAEREWLETAIKIDFSNAGFAIDRLSDGQMIGRTGLHSASPENRSATLGIMIGDRSCWDSGYGTDAMRVLCRFGFEYMNLHRIELDVFAANERAQHVYEKVGFQVEGRKRQAFFKHGRYQDVIVMGLLEGELRLD
jgi:RimJ/RimL family protein N-acetyltransferase